MPTEIIVIPADPSEPIHRQSVEDNLLKSIQDMVGGYVEPLRVGPWSALVNEDGMSLELPRNERASAFMETGIVGNVVLIGNGASDWTSVPDDLFEKVTAAV